MPSVIHVGDDGPEVKALQGLLAARGYPVEADGDFGPLTEAAVRAFQAQNLDAQGLPLVVDGRVGPLTMWSLTHPKPAAPGALVYASEPPEALGGSAVGRAALRAAIEELRRGAGEVGGNNRGPDVVQYLRGLAPEGSSWCAAFVSWCFAQVEGAMPFAYTVGARYLLAEGRAKGWARPPEGGYLPVPGDIVVWWRVRADGWQGHTGIVHHAADGFLHTIEGNRAPKVAGFSYVLSRMDRLLGYVHVP
jgi:hypothetical protein